MTQPIRIELDKGPDRDALVEFLKSRGLRCASVATSDGCRIDVDYATDPSERLRTEVSNALHSWLAEHDRPLIVTDLGAHSFVLRPPGD
jgi:hypothetical protein